MNCFIFALLVALCLSKTNALINDDSNVADALGIEERLTNNADGPSQEVQEPAESGHDSFFQKMKEAVNERFGLEPPSERLGSGKKKAAQRKKKAPPPPQEPRKAKGKTALEENPLALVKYGDHTHFHAPKLHPEPQEEDALEQEEEAGGNKKSARKGRGKKAEEDALEQEEEAGGNKKSARKGRGKNTEEDALEQEEEETKPAGKGNRRKAGGKASPKKGKTVGGQAEKPASAPFKYVEDYDKDKVDEKCIAPCRAKGEEMEHVFKVRVYLAKRKECRCYYEQGTGYVDVKIN